MPFVSRGAQRASLRAATGPSHVVRTILAMAIAGLGAMALPATPAEAACGTSWDSRSVPPERIRVGLVGRDKVEVVDFKRYVAVVMAKEWPSYLPRAAREAGATAVKQYAWYYALEGNHRSGYVTSDGDCYDVKNTTVDQLYMPTRSQVDDRIREAVNATWGLSLRKNGQFFLTGYRTGDNVNCGRDADGWRLYAKSVIDCARKDMARRDIQEVYYAPNISFHWADEDSDPVGDGVQPTVHAPKLTLASDTTLGAKIGRVTWSGSDASGIARFRLQRRIDGGRWRDVELADPPRPELT